MPSPMPAATLVGGSPSSTFDRMHSLVRDHAASSTSSPSTPQRSAIEPTTVKKVKANAISASSLCSALLPSATTSASSQPDFAIIHYNMSLAHQAFIIRSSGYEWEEEKKGKETKKKKEEEEEKGKKRRKEGGLYRLKEK